MRSNNWFSNFVREYRVKVILYPTSQATLVVEMGIRHSHQILLSKVIIKCITYGNADIMYIHFLSFKFGKISCSSIVLEAKPTHILHMIMNK